MGTGYMTPTTTPKNVTTESTLVLAAVAQPGALSYRLFQNDSDADIYLGLGKAAAAHDGILIVKAGGSFPMSRELGNLFKGAVYAIHASAGDKVLLVTQGV